jgi:hypothetical protein
MVFCRYESQQTVPAVGPDRCAVMACLGTASCCVLLVITAHQIMPLMLAPYEHKTCGRLGSSKYMNMKQALLMIPEHNSSSCEPVTGQQSMATALVLHGCMQCIEYGKTWMPSCLMQLSTPCICSSTPLHDQYPHQLTEDHDTTCNTKTALYIASLQVCKYNQSTNTHFFMSSKVND